MYPLRSFSDVLHYAIVAPELVERSWDSFIWHQRWNDFKFPWMGVFMQRLKMLHWFLIEVNSKQLPSCSLLNYVGIVLFFTAMWDTFPRFGITSVPLSLLLFIECPFWQGKNSLVLNNSWLLVECCLRIEEKLRVTLVLLLFYFIFVSISYLVLGEGLY